MLISAQERYWGQYVDYKYPSGERKKTLGEIVMLKNNEIIFYSHKRQRMSSFNLTGNCLEYHPGKHTKERIYYDPQRNVLYRVKPGVYFFISQKIEYFPVNNEIAKKQITEWLQD